MKIGQIGGVQIATDSGAPTGGTSGTGAGVLMPGSLYIDVATGNVYINSNTKASPTWAVVSVASVSAAELAFLDGVVAGTQAASKAIVNDANANQGAVKATSVAIGVSGSETALTATASEINQACDESANTEVVTATNIITAAESGKTFFLSSATEFVSTLPAPALGLRFTFIVAAAPSGASYTIVTDSSGNVILGHVLTSQDAGGSADSETSGGDTISFVDGKAVVGDRVDLICDGTKWYARGSSKVFDAIVISTAS